MSGPNAAAAWRKEVEEQFAEGARRMGEIAKKLDANTRETGEAREEATAAKKLAQDTNAKVTAHMEQMQPWVAAQERMESGIRALGKIGDAAAWCATWFRRAIIWVAPIVAFAFGLWTYVKTGHWKGE